MDIAGVKVLVLFETENASASEDETLQAFLEEYEEENSGVYDAVNVMVLAMLKNSKKFNLKMKGAVTPARDFNISPVMRAAPKMK